jgi:hypothetical protein
VNGHELLDVLAIRIAALAVGKRKFFQDRVESPSLGEAILELRTPEVGGLEEGVEESCPVGGREFSVEPALMPWRLRDPEAPALVYHHGNNESPFDFSRLAKNTFRSLFAKQIPGSGLNVVLLRAPFHGAGLKEYAERMKDLKAFVSMIAGSVRLMEGVVECLREWGCRRVCVCGPSLGGWVTNLHRAYFNTAFAYLPLLAGGGLGDMFVSSVYRHMVGAAGRENPEILRDRLNFDDAMLRVEEDNVHPLLARHDRIILLGRQKRSYGEGSIRVIPRGHITALLAGEALRDHVFRVLAQLS